MNDKEWKKYRLGDIAELRKEQIAPNGKEQIYLGLEHIEQQALRLNGFGSSNDVVSNKFKFYNGDILYGKLRPYFRKVFNPKFEGVCSTDIYVIKNKAGIDISYLFYLIATEDFSLIANSGSTGTHMPRADWNQLKVTEWLVPPLKTQTKIASILSSLDEKIELNRQTNQTLEAIAQTLFKEMCLPKSDELPEGWRVGKLGEIMNSKGGTTPSTSNDEYWNGEFNFVTPKDLSGLRMPVLLSTDRLITEKGLKQISSGLLPVGTLLMSSRAPIGYFAINQIPVAINQGFIAMNGTTVSNLFLMYWLKLNLSTIINMANGSTFLEISKSVIRNIDIVIPNQEILEKYDELIVPIFHRIVTNEQQTQTLISIRDSLLPKLMKGEIGV